MSSRSSGMSLPWVLAGVSALVWGVPLVIVFRQEIRDRWEARHDKWFRGD